MAASGRLDGSRCERSARDYRSSIGGRLAPEHHRTRAQKVTLLIGSDDGHVVYLDGKQVGILKGPRKLNPLAQEYELDLKKGDNDLYVKVVNHDGPSQLTFAFRSPAIDVPQQIVKLLSVRRKRANR